MAVPKHNEAYRAFLEALEDGQPHRYKHIVETLVETMGLTEAEKLETTPSKNNRFYSNLTWTAYNLKKAGLVESPVRGSFVITERGRKALDQPVIDDGYVKPLFPSPAPVDDGEASVSLSVEEERESRTPSEQLDNAYVMINNRLADELLEEIMKQSPTFFEHLVVKLLLQMGYGGLVEGAGQVVGKSGDGGIDGFIKEDLLGFDQIYIQAKRWDPNTTVGSPEMQKFAGALTSHVARKGLFVTTARFTKAAVEFAKAQHATKIILMDGRTLCRLMIEHNVGVATENIYAVKRLDIDFFSDI